MRLGVIFSGFKLAGLELVNPDSMGLEFKYPLGMWVLLIAVKDICESLVEIVKGFIGFFLEGGKVIGPIDNGLIRVDIAVDEVVVVVGIAGGELLILMGFEEGGEFHCWLRTGMAGGKS